MSRDHRLRKNNFPKREIPQQVSYQNMWCRRLDPKSSSIIEVDHSDHVDQHMICKPKWLSREVISLVHVIKDQRTQIK